jgi:hypothetical protein
MSDFLDTYTSVAPAGETGTPGEKTPGPGIAGDGRVDYSYCGPDRYQSAPCVSLPLGVTAAQ